MYKHLHTLFAILFCSLVLFSCDNDDTSPLDQLVGTCDIDSYVVVGCDDSENNWPGETGLIDCFNENDLEVCYTMTFTFNKGGTATSAITSVITTTSTNESQVFTETIPFSFTITGSDLTLCADGDTEDCNTFTFTINDTSITMRDTGDSSNCQTTFSGTKRS